MNYKWQVKCNKTKYLLFIRKFSDSTIRQFDWPRKPAYLKVFSRNWQQGKNKSRLLQQKLKYYIKSLYEIQWGNRERKESSPRIAPITKEKWHQVDLKKQRTKKSAIHQYTIIHCIRNPESHVTRNESKQKEV